MALSARYPAGGEWRLKYERAVREVDFTKKRLQQELEDKMEAEQQSRRQLERRVRLAGELRPQLGGLGLSASSTGKQTGGRQPPGGTGQRCVSRS